MDGLTLLKTVLSASSRKRGDASHCRRIDSCGKEDQFRQGYILPSSSGTGDTPGRLVSVLVVGNQNQVSFEDVLMTLGFRGLATHFPSYEYSIVSQL